MSYLLFFALIVMIAGKKWGCKSSRFRASNPTFCCKNRFEVSSDFSAKIVFFY